MIEEPQIQPQKSILKSAKSMLSPYSSSRVSGSSSRERSRSKTAQPPLKDKDYYPLRNKSNERSQTPQMVQLDEMITRQQQQQKYKTTTSDRSSKDNMAYPLRDHAQKPSYDAKKDTIVFKPGDSNNPNALLESMKDRYPTLVGTVKDQIDSETSETIPTSARIQNKVLNPRDQQRLKAYVKSLRSDLAQASETIRNLHKKHK